MYVPRVLLGVAALAAFAQPSVAGSLCISCNLCSRHHQNYNEDRQSCCQPTDCGRPERHCCMPQQAPQAMVMQPVYSQPVQVLQQPIMQQVYAQPVHVMQQPVQQVYAQPVQQSYAVTQQYAPQSAPTDCGRRAESEVANCNDRIDELEERMVRLSKSVNRLTRVAEALEKRGRTGADANGE